MISSMTGAARHRIAWSSNSPMRWGSTVTGSIISRGVFPKTYATRSFPKSRWRRRWSPSGVAPERARAVADGEIRSRPHGPVLAASALRAQGTRPRMREHHRRLPQGTAWRREWEQELARRAALGITGPEPLPHPDDIVIDTKTGQVIVKGPMTKEEKVVWDQMRARLALAPRLGCAAPPASPASRLSREHS